MTRCTAWADGRGSSLGAVVDVGHAVALRALLFWMVPGTMLAIAVQRLCARPDYRRGIPGEGRPHPYLGWILAGALIFVCARSGFPMYFARFNGIEVSGDRVTLKYPLEKEVCLKRAEISRVGTRRYFAAMTPWKGWYIFVDTRDGYRYVSVVSPTAMEAFKRLMEKQPFLVKGRQSETP